ncbi:hypothetical protein FLJU110815_15630 [Flavobacterium jumunjinense]
MFKIKYVEYKILQLFFFEQLVFREDLIMQKLKSLVK